MQQHVRSIHGGETFKCDFCSSNFNVQHHLKKHIESVHQGNAFKCAICPLIIKRQRSLKNTFNQVMNEKLSNVTYAF